MLENFKKTVSKILWIIFPLGFALLIIYSVIHTVGKTPITFIGALCILGIGIVIGIQIVEPQLFPIFFARIRKWLTFK
jgi:hypothetical protein